MEDLALYGPMKRPDKQGIDTYQTDDYGTFHNNRAPSTRAFPPEPLSLPPQATLSTTRCPRGLPTAWIQRAAALGRLPNPSWQKSFRSRSEHRRHHLPLSQS